jgi:hypothetical protein
MNRIHNFMCSHDVNLLGDNPDTAEKNTDTQFIPAKEISLTLNSKKNKHIVACRPVAR